MGRQKDGYATARSYVTIVCGCCVQNMVESSICTYEDARRLIFPPILNVVKVSTLLHGNEESDGKYGCGALGVEGVFDSFGSSEFVSCVCVCVFVCFCVCVQT